MLKVVREAFEVGDVVVKEGVDSRFKGSIVARFTKLNKMTVRYVIENDDGVLHIASAAQLRLIARPPPPQSTRR